MASSVINSFHYWLTLHSSGTMGCFHQQHPQLRIEASTTGAFVLNKYQPAASPTVISDFCRTKTTLCWQKDKDYLISHYNHSWVSDVLKACLLLTAYKQPILLPHRIIPIKVAHSLSCLTFNFQFHLLCVSARVSFQIMGLISIKPQQKTTTGQRFSQCIGDLNAASSRPKCMNCSSIFWKTLLCNSLPFALKNLNSNVSCLILF